MSVDERDKETIDRDGETAGGIKNFASNKSAVPKWCLNRSEQAKNTKALKDYCGISKDVDYYKLCIRTSQILKSNELLHKTATVLSKDYINPFRVEINQTKLVNLSSGLPVVDDLADEILISIPENSLKLYSRFKNPQLSSCPEDDFHKPINRNKTQLFNQANKCILRSNNSKAVKTIKANCNVIGRLLAISIGNGKLAHFETAMEYSLAPIPLSICNSDVTMSKASKSALMK